MISVYDLKSKFQDLLRPICQSLANNGVTANQITIVAMVLSCGYGALLCLNLPVLWLILPVIFLVRMALNAIDGMLAREHNMRSKMGMALNELGDVISDTALMIPFLFFAPEAAWSIGGFILVAAISEYCGLLAFMMNGNRAYDGPMGKSDRAVSIGIIALLIGLGVPISTYLGLIFAAITILCAWSCINRIRSALKE